MKIKLAFFAISASVLFVWAISCVDQDYDFRKLSDDMELNPGLPTTLGSKTIILEDLIKDLDSTIKPQIGADKFLTIAYSKPIDTRYADSIIKLPNQNYGLPLINLATSVSMLKTLDTTITQSADFLYNKDEEIDSVIISTMSITATLTSTLNKAQTLTITFPNIKKNNVPLTMTNLTCTGAGSCNTFTTSNLTGYTIVLDNTTPGKSKIPIAFRFIVTKPNGAQTILGKADVNVKMSSLVYKKLYGYMGSYDLLNDSSLNIETDFMDNSLTRNIQWANPTIKIIIDNNFGIPIQINIAKLSGDLPDGTNMPVLFPTAPSKKEDIGYPMTINDVGKVVKDSIVLDKTTSTIATLLNNNLKSIKAHIQAKANPEGKANPKYKENFVLDTSRIKAKVDIALPVWFKSTSFGTTDTMEMNIGDALGDNNSIQTLMIRFNTENQLPVDVKLKIYFADENYKILDSISSASGKILAAGIIDASTGRTTASKANIDLILDEQKAQKITNTKKAILKFEIQTANAANNEYVKFYADYSIKLVASIYIKAKIKF